MKQVIIALALLFIFGAFPLSAQNKPQDAVSQIVAPMRHIVFATEADFKKHAKLLQAMTKKLDGYSIDFLKKNEHYIYIGNAYMCYAISVELANADVDEQIKGYERALALRNDPTSTIRLATCYKIKYNEAVEADNAKAEIEYGKKIYAALERYLALSHNPHEKWKRLRDYFKYYAEFDGA